jgi:c-di-GMP-binding flagellar brake protein YcgR
MTEYQREKRRNLRKETNLEGNYWKHASYGIYGKPEKTTVVNLSTGGCCIRVSDGHDLHRNDSITLIFKLDNPEQTKIQKEAVVCRIDGNDVSCKFSFEHDKDIWFYVYDHIVPK